MSEIIVVDTNVIISALISGNEDILHTLSEPGDRFVSSNFVVVELFKHAPRIQNRSDLSQEQLLNLLAGRRSGLGEQLDRSDQALPSRGYERCCLRRSRDRIRRSALDTRSRAKFPFN